MVTPQGPVVGVLGGMGPDATVDFMARVLALTPAVTDQDHIPMLVDHNPCVPARRAALFDGGEDPGAAIAAMGQRLEAAGADYLVMVCNFAHAYVEQLQRTTTIPLLSIIEETAEACTAYARVAVLASDGCVAAGLYQAALAQRGIDFILPEPDEMTQLMRLIDSVKAGDRSPSVARDMRSLATRIAARGAAAIVAGCTEIPIVLDAADVDVPLVSSTDLLAAAVVKIGRGERQLMR